MTEALNAYGKGEKDAGKKFSENARAYISLLRQHIEKENNVLFPLADLRLSQDQQQRLAKEFQSFEAVTVGEGKHEEFHQVLRTLRTIYLS